MLCRQIVPVNLNDENGVLRDGTVSSMTSLHGQLLSARGPAPGDPVIPHFPNLGCSAVNATRTARSPSP
jgi:hypothetical protein